MSRYLWLTARGVVGVEAVWLLKSPGIMSLVSVQVSNGDDPVHDPSKASLTSQHRCHASGTQVLTRNWRVLLRVSGDFFIRRKVSMRIESSARSIVVGESRMGTRVPEVGVGCACPSSQESIVCAYSSQQCRQSSERSLQGISYLWKRVQLFDATLSPEHAPLTASTSCNLHPSLHAYDKS